MTYEPVDMSYAFSSSDRPTQANRFRQAENKYLDECHWLLIQTGVELRRALMMGDIREEVARIVARIPMPDDRGPHCFYCKDYGICEHNKDTYIGGETGSLAPI